MGRKLPIAGKQKALL